MTTHDESDGVIDLGGDHKLYFNCWAPDRSLNPQYDGIPDVERFGATIEHLNSAGTFCVGSVTFEGEVQNRITKAAKWKVLSWDPLTLEPSILCSCGDHGYIRSGRWEPC